MRTKLIILSIIAMALVVMAFPTNKFQPKTVWEHYCKYTLHIHPSQATEDQVYIPHQDKWNEHFPTPGKPNPNYYTDSGATLNKHLRTQNKLKSKQK